MRTVVASSIAMALFTVACASFPEAGPLGEGAALQARITAVDTLLPPRSAWIQMDQPGYVAAVLVAPGHSATLLYPSDSLTTNRLTAGAHLLTFAVPELLVRADSLRNPDRSPRGRPPRDSSILNPGRQRADTSMRGLSRSTIPLSPSTPTYLLLVTSPQPLIYQRLIGVTAGVSIPMVETEALNAVAKAIKSTIPNEPREWAGFYKRVELRRRN